jgi:hypothetical protein
MIPKGKTGTYDLSHMQMFLTEIYDARFALRQALTEIKKAGIPP